MEVDILKKIKIKKKYGGKIRDVIIGMIMIIISIFLVIELFIFLAFFSKYPSNLDYIIILGAKITEEGPSKALNQRLEEAILYLKENPNTNVIVSGGQGLDEPISEAVGMYFYLVENGISKERIIKEERSTNTNENLLYSKEYIDISKDTVGIVSNNYHIFRATQIAKKQNYNQVYGIPANTDIGVFVYNMVREFFGVMKEFIVGNI